MGKYTYDLFLALTHCEDKKMYQYLSDYWFVLTENLEKELRFEINIFIENKLKNR